VLRRSQLRLTGMKDLEKEAHLKSRPSLWRVLPLYFMPTLPVELEDLTFSFLLEGTKSEYRPLLLVSTLVNRRWAKACQRHLFSTFELDGSPIAVARLAFLITKPHLSALVVKLAIRSTEFLLAEDVVSWLPVIFSNAQSIHVRCTDGITGHPFPVSILSNFPRIEHAIISERSIPTYKNLDWADVKLIAVTITAHEMLVSVLLHTLASSSATKTIKSMKFRLWKYSSMIVPHLSAFTVLEMLAINRTATCIPPPLSVEDVYNTLPRGEWRRLHVFAVE
jgi:hypothetical protein